MTKPRRNLEIKAQDADPRRTLEAAIARRAADARLAGTDFDRLIERARGQRRALEPHRLAAAVESFAS